MGGLPLLPGALAGGLLRWGACLIYLLPLPRKPLYPLRAAGMLILSFLLEGVTLPLGRLGMVGKLVGIPICMLLYVLLMGVSCEKAKWSVPFYLGIWGLMTYLAVFELWMVLHHYGLPWPTPTWQGQIVLWLGLALLCYLPIGLTVSRWMPVYTSDHVGPRQMSSALVLYFIFTALIVEITENGELNVETLTSLPLFMTQIYCATVLYVQTALFKKSELQRELDTLNLLWHQQKLQYERSKENIALINQKCHDLKYQLAAMQTVQQNTSTEEATQDIEQLVRIYDAAVKTGNDTLDTVLTEKSLLCEAKGIHANCVVDGSSLDFMNPVDIYSIMGNAMDNAIEAIQSLPEDIPKTIDVLIHTRKQCLIISVTNPLNGELTFRDGIPDSTKPKNGYHGFGIRSIRSIARKYGGELTIDITDGFFSLRIVIPLANK